MGLSRNRRFAFGGLAVVGGTVAVIGFGVPLGTLLLVGILLCCPIMMFGMRDGGTSKPDGAPTLLTGPDQGPPPRG